MTPRKRLLCLAPLFLWSASVLAGSVPEIRMEAPESGTRRAALKTVWEIPAETEDYLIGYISDVGRDENGNILCLDYSLKNIKIFDRDGHWLRTVGGEGEGPGEVQDARKLFVDGSRLGVLQALPATIVWLNPDGTPDGEICLGQTEVEGELLSCSHAVQTGREMFGFFHKYKTVDGATEWISTIRKVEADGALGPDLYEEPEQPEARTDNGIDESKVYDIWLRRWTGDGQGGLWVAPMRDRYVLDHFDAAGRHDRRLIRAYEPRERSVAGRQRIITWFQKRGWAIDQIQVGRTAPVVSSLRGTADGRVWVHLDQGGENPAGPNQMVFDILDSGGHYLEHVRIDLEREADTRHFLDEEFVLSMATDENGEPVLRLEEIIPAP